ncbi:MAG TPA: hypothetical protein PLX35_11980 [Cyclobacteriaceae bacterium]|nr:hypothetical protein [Cyclobacteriaceae bacterium]
MIDIRNRRQVFELLAHLQPETPRKFGKLSPQGMIEHLAHTIQFSNGNVTLPLMIDAQLAAKVKAYTVESHLEFKPGFMSPVMPPEPPPLRLAGLTESINWLRQELLDFDTYFQLHPSIKVMHPAMGELSYFEQIICHSKHFTHHFKQFGLL